MNPVFDTFFQLSIIIIFGQNTYKLLLMQKSGIYSRDIKRKVLILLSSAPMMVLDNLFFTISVKKSERENCKFSAYWLYHIQLRSMNNKSTSQGSKTIMRNPMMIFSWNLSIPTAQGSKYKMFTL